MDFSRRKLFFFSFLKRKNWSLFYTIEIPDFNGSRCHEKDAFFLPFSWNRISNLYDMNWMKSLPLLLPLNGNIILNEKKIEREKPNWCSITSNHLFNWWIKWWRLKCFKTNNCINPYTKDDPQINQLQHEFKPGKHWTAQSTGQIHFNPDWNVESKKCLLVMKIAKKYIV